MGIEIIKLRFLCLVLLIIASFAYVVVSLPKHNISPALSLELEKKLNHLNKRPIKSIESPDGDIIDCINIYDQPAFDNPLLKNHTIQMKPSVYLKGSLGSNDKSIITTQLWQLNGSCPHGSIPIRRTRIEDLLRAESVEIFGTEKNPPFIPGSKKTNPPTHEYAVAYLYGVGGATYNGASATINVWNPTVEQDNEFSLAQIWVLSSPAYLSKDSNTVEAGWQVYPRLYGDRNTRLFIYWTSDGYKTKKCYNLNCPGFVQIDDSVVIGGKLEPISTYDKNQYIITLAIFKDPKTGHWWLQFGNKMVGYWPTSLFTYLNDGATFLEWGGEIASENKDGRHTATQMGSGHFPSEGFSKASFFADMKYIEEPNTPRDPVGFSTLTTFNKCYDIRKVGQPNREQIYFGGPGRSPTCKGVATLRPCK